MRFCRLRVDKRAREESGGKRNERKKGKKGEKIPERKKERSVWK